MNSPPVDRRLVQQPGPSQVPLQPSVSASTRGSNTRRRDRQLAVVGTSWRVSSVPVGRVHPIRLISKMRKRPLAVLPKRVVKRNGIPSDPQLGPRSLDSFSCSFRHILSLMQIVHHGRPETDADCHRGHVLPTAW